LNQAPVAVPVLVPVPVPFPVPVPAPVPAAAIPADPLPSVYAPLVPVAPAAPSRDAIIAALIGNWRGDGGGVGRLSHSSHDRRNSSVVLSRRDTLPRVYEEAPGFDSP
jgi:hypothetical protein